MLSEKSFVGFDIGGFENRHLGDGWGQKLLSSPKVTVFRVFHRASLDTGCTLIFTIEEVIN